MTKPVPAKLTQLLLSGREHHLAKGEVLFSTDGQQSLSLVKEGFIKRYLITNDGSLSVQSIYGPGKIFPLTHAYKVLLDQEIYDGPEIYHYEAVADSVVFTVDDDVLMLEVKKNPLLYKDLLIVAGERLQSNIQRLENLSLRVFYKRVAHQVAYFGRQFGKQKGKTTEIAVPLTQQDIANVLSATRETVSLSIIQLREKGLIKTGKNAIVIPDIDKLEDEAFS